MPWKVARTARTGSQSRLSPAEYEKAMQALRSGEPAARVAKRLGFSARAMQVWANTEGIKLTHGRPSKDAEPILQCSKCGRFGDSSHVCKGPTLAERVATAEAKESAEKVEKEAAERAARSAAVDEFIALMESADDA